MRIDLTIISSVLAVVLLAGQAQAEKKVGLHFVTSPEAIDFLTLPNQPPTQFINPYQITTPGTDFVTQGAFAGVSEQTVRDAVVARVNEVYFSVPAPAGQELDIDFIRGEVTGQGTVNTIIGAHSQASATWYGFAWLDGGFDTPDNVPPNGDNMAAVSVNRINDLPGVVFDDFDEAVRAIGNVVAHEVGHLLNLNHVCADPGACPGEPAPTNPYDIMATIPTGLPAAGWTTDMAITDVPGTQGSNVSSLARVRSKLGWRRIGDTDDDFDVDTGDITTAITNYTGAVGMAANMNRAEGDFDHDYDVDTGDLTLAIVNFTGAAADPQTDPQPDPTDEDEDVGGFVAATPSIPDLIYDPATGDVRIDADGADLISFSLQGGPFNTANLSFDDLPAGLEDAIATQVGWTSFNLFSGLTGAADLGAILPAGLDEAGIDALLTSANYGLSLGSGGGGGAFDIIIPEPASIATLLLVSFAIAARRRPNSFKR